MAAKSFLNAKNLFIVALVFPVLVLLALTFTKTYSLQTGQRIVLPISGYDPRDLLAGHYLTYRVDYGIPAICEDRAGKTGCVCFPDLAFGSAEFVPECEATGLAKCELYIRGVCSRTRFKAGIERFYITESKAEELDRIVRTGVAEIRVSVSSDGSALVEELILPDE